MYGEYLGILAVNLPGYAAVPHVDGNPPWTLWVARAPRGSIATPVDVKEGQAQQVVVRFTLPLSSGEVNVLPTARLTPVTWHYRGSTSATPPPSPFPSESPDSSRPGNGSGAGRERGRRTVSPRAPQPRHLGIRVSRALFQLTEC